MQKLNIANFRGTSFSTILGHGPLSPVVPQSRMGRFKYLKQLYADTGKNELEQKCDEEDIADSLDCNDDTLDDVLSTKQIQHASHACVCV